VSVYVVLSGPPAAELLRAAASPAPVAAIPRVQQRLRAIRAEHDALRPQLEAEGARVVAELSRLANVIQVQVPRAALPRLARLPGVDRIEPVTTVWPTLASSLAQIGAPALWSNPTAYTGRGIRIGVIDTGIDYTHADFGGSGDPEDYERNDPDRLSPDEGFPSAKVAGGTDLAGDDYDPADADHDEPTPDPDPLDCSKNDEPRDAGGHGTHVAGVIAGGGVLLDGSAFAGPYDQSLDPSAFLIFPGVAPEAQLYAIKVFGCSGGSQLAAAGLEWASDPNQDGDFSDRLDVVNASLGTVYGLGSPVETELIDRLTGLGTVVVMAGGNDGASFFTVDAPGIVPAALSVAASQTPELLALEVVEPASVAGRVPAAEGDFTLRLNESGPITGLLRQAAPPDGCATLTNAGALQGQVALIDRGGCPFVDKLQRAASAGALAAVVIDDEDQDLPVVMGGDSKVVIPGVMIRRADGLALQAELDAGVLVTLDGTETYDELNTETIAAFSSRGPSAVDSLLKPELSAPGTSIDSARVATGSASRRAQGTSVATPLVAGGAALLRQAHPSWPASDIKAVLMNTAVELADEEGKTFPVSMAGAGRMDLAEAASRMVTARVVATDGSVAVSFGPVIVAEPTSVTRQVVLTHRGDDPVSYQVTVAQTHPLEGVGVAVTPEVVTVLPGGQAQVSVVLAVDPARLGAPGPDPLTPLEQDGRPRHFLSEASGRISFDDSSGEQSLTLPFYGVVRAAAERRVGARTACVVADHRATVLVDVAGPSAHPDPVVTAFELGILHPPRPASEEDPAVAIADVLAVGAASNVRSAGSVADCELSFGIAIAGQWPTPARGPHHPVGIYLDTDLDEETDYYTLALPLNKDGPYADTLLSVTYDAETRQPVGSPGYVNLLPADQIDTQPFYNGVVVLPVPAAAIGLSDEQSQLGYAAFARSRDPDVDDEVTEWALFDAALPVLDATASSAATGAPIYTGEGPVWVDADLAALGEDGGADLLLLHHTNVAGGRHEILRLESWQSDALVLDPYTSRSVEPGGRVYGRLVVHNRTDRPAEEVRLEGGLRGGAIELVATSRGDCLRTGAVACTLGTLEPGESVDLSIQATAAHSLLPGDAAELRVTMSAADGCSVTLDAVMPVPNEPDPGLRPHGGCSCHLVGPAERRLAPWMAALLGWAVPLLRRRAGRAGRRA
jgi:subtilisin family serine protease